MAVSATNDIANWKFASQHVQENLTGGDFIGSHSTIICATAPHAADLVANPAAASGIIQADATNGSGEGKAYAVPIGIIDSAALQQDRQLAQIFEIGSNRSYLMSARTMTQMSINRVMYKGPNLLRALYAYVPVASDVNKNMYKNSKTESAVPKPVLLGGAGTSYDTMAQNIKNIPGYNNFWLNLASDLFSHPMGLLLYWRDNDDSDVAAVYLEDCYIQNHAMSISANSVIMAESCTIRCDRVLPIKVRVDEAGSVESGGGL